MTAPVSSREQTGIRFAVRSVLDVYDFVDQVDKNAVGELVFTRRDDDDDVLGVVFIESGRVCWAAARGLARRLTELLLARSLPRYSAAMMEDLFRHCQTTRTPLGELLVERNIIQPIDLRDVLFEHTAESIDALCSTPEAAASAAAAVAAPAASWVLRRTRGYSSQFTFSSAELLARTVRRELPLEDQAHADEALIVLREAFTVKDEWGAAFMRGLGGSAPSPIVVHGDIPTATSDVLRVGKWAASALDLASTFQDADALVTSLDTFSATVAWRCHHANSATTLIAGRMHPQGPARLLNRRAAMRRERANRERERGRDNEGRHNTDGNL